MQETTRCRKPGKPRTNIDHSRTNIERAAGACRAQVCLKMSHAREEAGSSVPACRHQRTCNSC